MKTIALTFAGLCAALVLSAQTCGTQSLAQPDFNLAYETEVVFDTPETNHKHLKRALNGRVSVYSLQYYVVSADDIPRDRLQDDVQKVTERMNQHFGIARVMFEAEKEIVQIKDSRLTEFVVPNDEKRLVAHKRTGKKIHVFLVLSIQNTLDALMDGYTYNAYSEDALPYQKDFLVIDIDKFTDASTLSHEMGHFFGLQHTHEYTGTGKAEWVERHRCTHMGDGFCDTPADPNLFGWVDQNGKYTGIHRDAEGNGYAPMVNNLMSYAPSRFRNEFTAGQARRIEQTALFRRQNLIVRTGSHAGSLTPTVSYLTLAGAYEQFKLGGPDKAVIMLHRDSAMWSARMVRELASMIQHNAPYHNVIEMSDQYTFVLFDGDEQQESISDFIGNLVFQQPNEMSIADFEWLSMLLRENMMEYPCLLLIEFSESVDYRYRIMGYQPGYLKPQEVRRLLLRHTGDTRLLTKAR